MSREIIDSPSGFRLYSSFSFNIDSMFYSICRRSSSYLACFSGFNLSLFFWRFKFGFLSNALDLFYWIKLAFDYLDVPEYSVLLSKNSSAF